jgi:transcriptional regulator with XRE-family HTH domain
MRREAEACPTPGVEARMRTKTLRQITPTARSTMPPRPVETKPDRDWFVAQLDRVNLSQREFARRIGVNASVINRALKGLRNFNLEEIAALARTFGTDTGEVIRRLGYEVPLPSVEIVGRVTGEAQVSAVTARRGQVVTVPSASADSGALLFETGGSPLSWLDRGALVYRPGIRAPACDACDGALCVIESERWLTPVVGTLRHNKTGRWSVTLLGSDDTTTVEAVHVASRVLAIYTAAAFEAPAG